MGRGFAGSTSSRVVAALVAGAVSLAVAAPAAADFQPSVTHIWRHVRSLADRRYVRQGDVKTLRGPFSLYRNDAPGPFTLLTTAITFSPPLPAAPIAFTVMAGDPPRAECPGTAAAPEALPGYLCIYVHLSVNAERPGVQDPASYPGSVGTYGTTIYVNSLAAGAMETRGTWAVTRP